MSCSSLKVKDEYSSIPEPVEEIDEVFFFSANDSMASDIHVYGEIELREDLDVDWDRNKSRLIDFARASNCNGIIFKDIGWSSHGNGFYTKAELFYYQQEKMNSLYLLNSKKEQCTLTIYRNEGEPPLAAGFKADLNVNGQDYNDFKNRSFISVEAINCDSMAVLVNQIEFNINFNERKHLYFRLFKIVSDHYWNTRVDISYGDFVLVEIDDLELGKLLSEQYQNYSHQDL